MANNLLEVEEISTRRGTVQVLFGVSLTVRPGEAVALLGRNGAGKTTTLRSIMGLSPPFAGEVRLYGTSLTRLPAYRVSRLGLALVPEDRGILSDLTVAENLRLFMRNGQHTGPAWDVDRVLGLFPVLRDTLKHSAGQLSGGQQQMLAIARALVANPKLLLLDEPFQGLAPKIVSAIQESLVGVRETGIGLILSEQSLLALDLADRAYIIDRGVIRHEAATSALRSEKGLLETYLGAGTKDGSAET